ncbi:MAG: hypothetical protein HFI67_00545 [Lachnospiraceae bacterium]|jgi:DNA-directed RNA polymerase subunit RPC12/RpoP|nr:hypothetical protein [Lachnospiraceae bacterium]
MVITYKCPSCGAPMVFDPESQKLTCGHCGTGLSVKEYEEKYGKPLMREETEQEKAAGRMDAKPVETEEEGSRVSYDQGSTMNVKKYHCSSCGAEVITDETTAASICGFCGSPTLLEERMEGAKRPERVLPFQITREQAVEKFRAWTKRGLFTPKGFRSQSTIDKITGIYVPFWLVDYRVGVRLHAHCTRTRVTRSDDTEYIYTDHYDVRRNVKAGYEKIPMDASEKMDDETMDLLEPFNYQELKPFDLPYLSGYLADIYSYTEKDMEGRGKKRVRGYALAEARGTISGYSGVNVVEQQLRVDETGAEYVLLPVWMLNYRYQGKQYQFAINGQTGKLVGTLPISKGRMFGWWAGLTGGFFAAITLISVVGGLL